MIGGEGELSEVNRRVTSSMMHAMPLHNYEDLPRDGIAMWCDFFVALDVVEKTALFKAIWDSLSSPERDAVVADLKLFVARAYEMSALLAQADATSTDTAVDPDLD